jgi:hypothetical protein
MHANSSAPDPIDVAGYAGGILVAFSTLTFQLFPFAVPLLALTFAPLLVLALAGLLLALPIVLPLWLGRLAFRAVRRAREPRPLVHHRPSQPAR